MYHYLPTVQDVLATMTPADQAELLALVGQAAAGQVPGDDDPER